MLLAYTYPTPKLPYPTPSQERKWHTAKYGDPYSEFTHPSAHTQQWTHTHTHTVSIVITHFLLKGTSVGVSGVEKALYIHSPPPTIPAEPRLEPTTFRLWL